MASLSFPKSSNVPLKRKDIVVRDDAQSKNQAVIETNDDAASCKL
jgi:hypothetical protein